MGALLEKPEFGPDRALCSPDCQVIFLCSCSTAAIGHPYTGQTLRVPDLGLRNSNFFCS